MAIVLVFFFWPAGQALYQSVLEEDAFGMSRRFVGWQNFSRLFNDPLYLESFQTTAIFSLLVAVVGLSLALLLAVMADRVLRAANIYKTLLIWPTPLPQRSLVSCGYSYLPLRWESYPSPYIGSVWIGITCSMVAMR
jgi:ABC-type sugar transport system permease subunit